MKRALLFALLALPLAACENDVESPGSGPSLADGGGGEAALPGVEVSVDVPETGRAFVDLDAPGVVAPPSDGMESIEWDLAFAGRDVFTNSGPSGPGDGKAFGPLDALAFVSETPPDVPFLRADETGGALSDWYLYDSSSHVLYSRFHVYGVRRGERLYKLQILGYYGEISGAPVSGIYSLRFAEVTASGAGASSTLENIDATAGGTGGSEDEPSACLELASKQITLLTPDAARATESWDLCFRRSTISVNGELGGPGSVVAADLDLAATSAETLQVVEQRTAESELPHFDAASHAELTNPELVYRGDRVISAFSDQWLDESTTPPSLREAAWRVVSADGARDHVLGFTELEWASSGPRRVTFRLKSY